MICRITIFTGTSIARKILLKQFSLTILHIKHRNVVTLDRNFKRTQDEIARQKNLRQNYRLLLFVFTSLNERSFILVYGTKLNRDVNTHETLQKAVSIQHEINCLLAQNPRIQNKQVTYLKYVLKYVNKKFEPSLPLYTVVYKSIYIQYPLSYEMQRQCLRI